MSYLPSGLADLASAFDAEEEEVLRVHMGSRGESSDITLLHRYVSAHDSHSDVGGYDPISDGLSLNGFVQQTSSTHLHNHHHHHSSHSHHHHQHQQFQQIPRRSTARPMPPLNPQTLHGSLSSTTPQGIAPVGADPSSNNRFGVESPYLFRRMSDLSRRLGSSTTDLSGFNLSGGMASSVGGSPCPPLGTSGNVNVPPVAPDLEESDGEPVRQSTSSESQALYGNENLVTELKPDYVRWFYKYEQDRKWTPFAGYDSIRMENRYRNLLVERDELQNAEYYGNNSSVFSGTAGTNVSTNGYEVGPHNGGYFESGGGGSSSSYSNGSRATDSGHQYDNYGDWTSSNVAHEAAGNGGYSQSRTDAAAASTNHYGKYDYTATADYSGSQQGHGNNQTPAEPNPVEDCIGNVIIVRGGLYEADLETWTCVATYWPGDKCLITRGTWFYDGTWQPLSVEHAEKLEEEHLGQFAGVCLEAYANNGGQPDSPTRKSRPVVHRVSFCEFHVDWTGPTDIHLFSKAASHKFMRSVGLRLGFQAWGYRVCRGYYKSASFVDRPSEISHVVFVIHGIGQKMDTGRIVRNCASFRETVSSLKEKYLPHLNEAKQRAEFFPVEWRSAAKLDDDIVDAITPHKLLSLRQLLNATAMDIMYYTSPLYRSEITNALRNELNRIYANFVKRNPDFITRGGKVSVIAHSLGAVITYDIVTGYTPDFSNVPEQQNVPYGTFNNMYPGGGGGTGHSGMNDGSGGYNSYHQQQDPAPGLLFDLEHFFCLGSPLSVFLALRWREPHNPEVRSFVLPEKLCKRIYNIFYPSDPVAYRLEPLLNKYYIHIAPLGIHTYGTLGRPRYDEMPRERISKESSSSSAARTDNNGAMFTATSHSENSSAKSTPQRFSNLKSPPTPTKESNWGWFGIMKYLKSSENPGGAVAVAITDSDLAAAAGAELISPDGNSSPCRDDGGSTTPEYNATEIPNDIDYRIDYVLKESNFSSTYLAALTSHTSYWSSPDTAYFVLMHLYGGLDDSPQQSQAQ